MKSTKKSHFINLNVPPTNVDEIWNEIDTVWNEQEIKKLVLSEIDCDILFPRGFQVLVKIWMPDKKLKSGLERTDHNCRNERVTACVGKILRMGPEAFTDTQRFPYGPRVMYGEWIVFRSTERQLIQVDQHFLGLIGDDRFLCMTTEPERIVTTFDLEYQHTGS